MMPNRIYSYWTMMMLVAVALIGLYEWMYGNMPYVTLTIPLLFASGLIVTLVANFLPRYAKAVLFLNILSVSIFVYWTVNELTMTVCLLFFVPVYSLMFNQLRYFIACQVLTGIGYLLTSQHHSLQLQVIFFIIFLAYSSLLGFVARFHAQKASEAALYRERVEVFSKAIEARDAYTKGHSRRVSLYAVEIGRHVPGLDLKQLRIAGDLHDIGKIATPDAVLLKPGRLTAEEYETIKRHTTDGADILRQFGIDGPVLEGTLYHHERMNGTGYPEGLSGEAIPLFARILAIADTFDAMTTTRSYRKAFEPQAAYDEIVQLAGSFYDPELVDCFRRAYPAILSIWKDEAHDLGYTRAELLPTSTS